jgi:hypothetical protein
VERAPERDEAGPAGRVAGQLERRLDRLGARVPEFVKNTFFGSGPGAISASFRARSVCAG